MFDLEQSMTSADASMSKREPMTLSDASCRSLLGATRGLRVNRNWRPPLHAEHVGLKSRRVRSDRQRRLHRGTLKHSLGPVTACFPSC